ncbi:PPE domain-containing protein [Nocardia vulneris]|uniref:PPE domain-containing protein n=1 Tax=Nocardia vulneris TaxID=1141657 RepID=UPI0030CF51FD
MTSYNDWLVGLFTGSSNEAGKNKTEDQQRAADEKAKWDEDRGYVNNEWSSLLSEYGSNTFAGRAIKAQDPFETMSHQAIYDALEGVDPGTINTAADGWRRLSASGRTAVEEFSKSVEQSITDLWTGKSGSSAIDATREFSASFTKLAATFQMVGHGLDLTQGHLAQAKASVGKPDNYTVGDKFIDMLPGQNVVKGPTYRAEEAEKQARFVMTQYYRPGVNEVDGITPILPEPTTTIDKGKAVDPGTGPSSNPSSNPGSDNPSNNGSPEEKKTTEEPSSQDPATPQSTEPASTNPGDDPDTSKQPSTTPASTTPANTSPTDPNAPKTQSPTSNVPSTHTGTPSGVPGSPGSPRATPDPGKSVPGKANTGTPAAAANAATRAASTGRAGTSGMGGMGAPGARGKGDEDDEHKTPDYLIYDRGSELLGTQPPALPPGGVIGG